MTIPIQIHFNFVKKIIFYIKILKRNNSDYQNGTMTGFILFSLWSYEKITLENRVVSASSRILLDYWYMEKSILSNLIFSYDHDVRRTGLQLRPIPIENFCHSFLKCLTNMQIMPQIKWSNTNDHLYKSYLYREMNFLFL